MTIDASHIPPEVWNAFHDAVQRYGYGPHALAAGLNAWPGAVDHPATIVSPRCVWLPLPQEPGNE